MRTFRETPKCGRNFVPVAITVKNYIGKASSGLKKIYVTVA